MSDAGSVDRSQTKDLESVVQTRQDRNTIISGGGNWSWDAVADVLSWDGQIDIYVGGLGSWTIASGSQTGLINPGDGVRVIANRGATGSVTKDKQFIDDATFFTDDGMLLGVRGVDDRFYMRDGTVFTHGEVKKLGTVQTLVDRVETDSYARTEFVTGHQVDQDTGNGVVNGGGTNFNDGSASKLWTSTIPNTAGDPDTPTYIRIQGVGVYRVSSVVDDENLTLSTSAPIGAGLTYEVYDRTIGYTIGVRSLMVVHTDASSNSEILIPGVDYTEVGSPGSLSHTIDIGGTAPASGVIQFINLTGGQGPSGDEGTVSLQDAYDISRDITLNAGNPIILRAASGPDLQLEGRIGGGPSNWSIDAAGVLTVSQIRIKDGAGQNWIFQPQGGQELRISHDSLGMGFEIPPGNPVLRQVESFSPVGVGLRWSKYSGTFDGSGSAVTVSAGLTSGMHAAFLQVEDQGSSRWYIAQHGKGADANADVICSYDVTSGDFEIADTLAGTGAVGSDFFSGDWVLFVLHA
jgi:hypothetical protein